MRDLHVKFAAAFVLVAVIGGCYSAGDVCELGVFVACVGDDGCSGLRACGEDGSLGACVCDEPSAASMSTGSTGGSSMGAEEPMDVDSLTDVGSSTGAGSSTDADACSCEPGQQCEEGECVPCDAQVGVWNLRPDTETEMCKNAGELRSVMYLTDENGKLSALRPGEGRLFTLKFGETTQFTVECCLVDTAFCEPGFMLCPHLFESDGNFKCQCVSEAWTISGDSCGSQIVVGCQP